MDSLRPTGRCPDTGEAGLRGCRAAGLRVAAKGVWGLWGENHQSARFKTSTVFRREEGPSSPSDFPCSPSEANTHAPDLSQRKTTCFPSGQPHWAHAQASWGEPSFGRVLGT